MLGTGTLGSNGQATYATSIAGSVGPDLRRGRLRGLGQLLGLHLAAVLTQVVNAAATTTSLTSSPNPSTYGASVTFTATVSASTRARPRGTVTFYQLRHVVVWHQDPPRDRRPSRAAKATYSTTHPARRHRPTSRPSTRPRATTQAQHLRRASSQKVNQASTSLVLSASLQPLALRPGDHLERPDHAGDGADGHRDLLPGQPRPTAILIGTATLNASGQATLVTKALPPGTYTIYAVYSGNANFVSSQSNTLTLTVGYSSPCLTGTISGGYTVASGQSICISGKVTGGVSVQPGGALFLSGANVSGGISSNGAAAIRFCGSTISGNVPGVGDDRLRDDLVMATTTGRRAVPTTPSPAPPRSPITPVASKSAGTRSTGRSVSRATPG